MEQIFYEKGKELFARSLQGEQIDDGRLSKLIAFMMTQRIPRFRKQMCIGPSIPVCLHELDLGKNNIGDSGIRELVGALLKDCIELRVLKLHRNRIGSAGAQEVKHFIEKVTRPPEELHLSHNCLGPPDARRLFVAVARRREYPLRGSHPLWLRLERQQDYSLWNSFEGDQQARWDRMKEMIGFADTRLLEVRSEMGYKLPREGGPLICQVLYRRWQAGARVCKSKWCCYAESDGTGPILHLPYMWDQGYIVCEDQAKRDEMAARLDRKHDHDQQHWRPGPDDRNHGKASNETFSGPSRPNTGFRYMKEEPTVLFESANIMVLNKTAFWLCVYGRPGQSNPTLMHQKSRNSLEYDRRSLHDISNSASPEHLDAYLARRFTDEMATAWWDTDANAKNGAGCVHRLDKETSGCLIRAKTKDAFDSMVRQVHRQAISKTYICLVHGLVPPGRELLVDDPIGVDMANNEAYIDTQHGDWAETRVRCLGHFEADDSTEYSFCEVKILTGRTHQIRVHMMHKRFPLVSDSKYCPLLVSKDRTWCQRTFLHAFSVAFYEGSVERRVTAPLPADLSRALSYVHLKADYSKGRITRITGIPATSESCPPSMVGSSNTDDAVKYFVDGLMQVATPPPGAAKADIPALPETSNADNVAKPVNSAANPAESDLPATRLVPATRLAASASPIDSLPEPISSEVQPTSSTSQKQDHDDVLQRLGQACRFAQPIAPRPVNGYGSHTHHQEASLAARSDNAVQHCIHTPRSDNGDAATESRTNGANATAVSREELSPRALRIVGECVSDFALDLDVEAERRRSYTISKLRKCGLCSTQAILDAQEQNWPKDKAGAHVLPRRLMDLIRKRVEDEVAHEAPESS